MEQPFNNYYCPCCLRPVNPVTGDHWYHCEYEVSFGDWINPNKPLTEIEMLEQKLLRTEDKLKSNRKHGRELKKRVDAIKTVISAKSDIAGLAI